MSNQIETIIENTPEYKARNKGIDRPSRSPHKNMLADIDKIPETLRSLANLNFEGTTKLFTPDQLYIKANEYFEHCVNNPIQSQQLITGGQSAGTVVPVSKPRLFTIEGYCIYLGVNRNYLEQLIKSIEGKKDEINTRYSCVINYIKTIISQQRFEFAAVREFDAMFIAKLEGLTDKIEHSGEVKNTVTSITFTPRTIEDAEFNEVQDALDQE